VHGVRFSETIIQSIADIWYILPVQLFRDGVLSGCYEHLNSFAFWGKLRGVILLGGNQKKVASITETVKDRNNQKCDNFIVLSLMAAFGVGAVTRFSDIISGGLSVYLRLSGVHPLQIIFWYALLVVEPALIVLLYKKRIVGAMAGFLVILADVMVNYHYQLTNTFSDLNDVYFIVQCSTLVFSAVSLPKLLMRRAANSGYDPFYYYFFELIPLISLTTGLMITMAELISVLFDGCVSWKAFFYGTVFVLNCLIIVGLVRKLRTGFVAALVAVILLACVQVGMAVETLLGFGLRFVMGSGVTFSLCCLSIAALLLREGRYTERFFSPKK